MPLREELERSGTWLFRWRSYVPLVLLPLVAIAYIDFRYPRDSRALNEVWEALCLAVSVAGIAIRAKTIGHTPAGTSGRNTAQGQVASVVNRTGMYSVVRHPLYVGNYLMWLGIMMLPRAVWPATVISLAYWLYYERIMFAEEEYLRRKFGAEYEAWASVTPAFLPDFGKWVRPELPFCLKTVLKREYSGVFAVTVLFAAADLAGNAIAGGRARLDAQSTVLLGIGVVVYAMLLVVKRRTRWLRVEGR